MYDTNLVLQFSVDLVLDLSTCLVESVFVHSGSRTPAIKLNAKPNYCYLKQSWRLSVSGARRMQSPVVTVSKDSEF